MDFWIGAAAAAVAVLIVVNKRNDSSGNPRRSPALVWVGITAAVIGLIGYLFFGWRF